MNQGTSEHLSRWKTILKIAWPLIIANSFWNLQITIDRIFLGQLSTDSLGAAIAVMGVFWTPMALLQQTAAYATTFIAQYYGAKKFEMIGSTIWHAFYLSILGGLLFLLLIPLSQFIFSSIGHSENLIHLENEYFIGLCYSALPTALVAVASAFFTGLGFTQKIIWINGVGLMANVVLDYLLIFGNLGFPELGIFGAGIATATANWAAAIYGLWLVYAQKNAAQYKLKSSYKIQWPFLRRFLKYGLPSGLQWALEGLAFTVFLIIIGRMPNGSSALASSSIAATVMMLAILPALGMAQAVSVLVGQHLGDKNPELARQATWSGAQVAWIYIALVALTFAFMPQFYLQWFTNESDPALWVQVTHLVPKILLIVACFILFDCTNLIFSFALRGAGDTRFVSFIALTLPWPLMVAPTWLLQHHEDGVYWAWVAASCFIITQSLVFVFRFKRGKWKTMSVIH